MTEAQVEALQRMHQLMSEHFDAGVIAITADLDLEQAEQPQVRFHGGLIRCVGLAQVANLYLGSTLGSQLHLIPPPQPPK